jgi:hypothetical protein
LWNETAEGKELLSLENEKEMWDAIHRYFWNKRL